MQFPAPVAISWIAELIDAQLIGNTTGMATGINEIHNVQPGDLVFVDHPKYYQKCLNSAATFIIINTPTDVPQGKALLVTPNPFEAYCKIVQHFRPFAPSLQPVAASAVIDASAVVFPQVYIGNRVRIGAGSIIYPNVTILDDCIIGNNVIIQSGTVIGSDAFYYNTKKNRSLWYQQMPSAGNVVIEDAVEIGANCTIDRGVSATTRIGAGTKFDNLVHIGHDTVIGKNCLFAAQVVVGGCTVMEDGVTVWGQVAINKTLHIGAGAVILGQSGVGHSLKPNTTYFGSPAQEAAAYKRDLVWIKRIPELWAGRNK